MSDSVDHTTAASGFKPSSICQVACGRLNAFVAAHPKLAPVVGRIARFSAVGAMTGLIFAVVTAAAVSLAGLPAVAASVAGYLVAIPVNFILQRSVTFRSAGA